MEDQNYTIKDIARMARVFLPERLTGCCTIAVTCLPKAKPKYKRCWMRFIISPMCLLSVWLLKKKYSFLCLIPYYIEHDYWHSVVGGLSVPGKNYVLLM